MFQLTHVDGQLFGQHENTPHRVRVSSGRGEERQQQRRERERAEKTRKQEEGEEKYVVEYFSIDWMTTLLALSVLWHAEIWCISLSARRLPKRLHWRARESLPLESSARESSWPIAIVARAPLPLVRLIRKLAMSWLRRFTYRCNKKTNRPKPCHRKHSEKANEIIIIGWVKGKKAKRYRSRAFVSALAALLLFDYERHKNVILISSNIARCGLLEIHKLYLILFFLLRARVPLVDRRANTQDRPEPRRAYKESRELFFALRRSTIVFNSFLSHSPFLISLDFGEKTDEMMLHGMWQEEEKNKNK